MTSPDHNVPDGGYVVSNLGQLQALDESKIKSQLRSPAAKALEEMKASLADNFIAGIGQAIANGLAGIVSGIFSPVSEAIKPVADGQLALGNRIDLIPTGYCSAFMDKNVNLEWGLNNTRLMPFRAQLGPNDGAHIDAANSRIVFDRTGTWTVYALLNCRGTIFTGDNGVLMTVRVCRPDGSVYSQKFARSSPNTNPDTLTLTQPFVISQAGSYVEVIAWSGRWRWWDGGTEQSGLTVLRHARGTENPGTDTVPDETQSEAKS